jgi:GDP-L-fucose synthase
VAGGAGLVGSSLIKQLLDAGAYVVATEYQNRKIKTIHDNLSVLQMDLNDIQHVKSILKNGIDYMFLAAAKVGGAKSILNSPIELVSHNLPLHYNLLKTAFDTKIDKVAFISSSYIYPDTGRPNVESEGFIGNPQIPTNYGLGWVKRYLETVCKFFSLHGKTKFLVARPTSIIGPNDSFDLESCHAVPALIRKVVEKQNPLNIWGDGSQIRCHTYVDDFVEGLMLLVEKRSEFGAFNICTSEESSITDVVNLLLKIENFNPDVIYQKDKPTVCQYKASDPSLAFRELGWKAKTSLEEGLRKTVAWYKENRT